MAKERYAQAALLLRIEQILNILPDGYPDKSALQETLLDRQASIRATAPEAIGCRWLEVSQILAEFLPHPDEVGWARTITELFSAPLPKASRIANS